MDIFKQTKIPSLHFVMSSIIFWAQIHFIIYEFSIYFFVHDNIIRRIANVNMFSLHITFHAYKNVMWNGLFSNCIKIDTQSDTKWYYQLYPSWILNWYFYEICVRTTFLHNCSQMKLYYTCIFYSFNVPRSACCSNPFMLSE